MSFYSPLNDYTISSGFGPRSSPGGIGSTNHKGIDLAAPTGTPVYAPTDITIQHAGNAGGFGNLITGVDSAGNTYEFGHLSAIGVVSGEVVSAGAQIGAVGSTGNSTGSHLHFGIKNKLGQYINPDALLSSGIKKGVAIVKNKALELAGRAGLAAATGGASEAVMAVTGGIPGLGGSDGSWIDQIKEWFKSSGFFQRLALAVIAVVFLMAAFSLLARGQATKVLSQAVK